MWYSVNICYYYFASCMWTHVSYAIYCETTALRSSLHTFSNICFQSLSLSLSLSFLLLK